MRVGLGVKVSLGVIGVSLIFAVLKMSQLLDKAKNYVAEKVTNMPKPEASVTDVDFKRVSRDSVEYLAKVSVSNPYSTPIPICEIKYSLQSAGRFLPLYWINWFCFVFVIELIIDHEPMMDRVDLCS